MFVLCFIDEQCLQKRGWYAEQDGSIRKSRNICGEPGDSNLKVLKVFESIKSIKVLESHGTFVEIKVWPYETIERQKTKNKTFQYANPGIKTDMGC